MKPSKRLWNNIWSRANICYPHDIVLFEIDSLVNIKKILEIGGGADLEELSKRGYDVKFSDFSLELDIYE